MTSPDPLALLALDSSAPQAKTGGLSRRDLVNLEASEKALQQRRRAYMLEAAMEAQTRKECILARPREQWTQGEEHYVWCMQEHAKANERPVGKRGRDQ